MRNFYLLIVAILVSSIAGAQTWNGTINTNWDLATNWSGGAVPTATGDVIIPTSPTGGVFPVFATNVSIRSIDMKTGSQLDVNGKTLTVAPTAQFIFFTGSTINNSGTGDIVLNINTGTGGYGMYIRNGAVFNDDVVFNASGSNVLNEGDVAGNNQFNGNLTFNINSNLTLTLSSVATCIYNGNLTVNRTVAGTSNLFNSGATITGNFSYNSMPGGSTNIGNLTNLTTIGGTLNIYCINATLNSFNLLGVKNNAGGGIIDVQGSQGFNVTNDTINVSSLSITGYSGSAFGFLQNNKISGNVTLNDDISYSGGFGTYLRNNNITGNASYTVKGPNTFADADNINSTNTYTGNVSFNIPGNATVSFSVNDTVSITGNLTITRTGAGTTSAFGYGGNIGGAFTFSNNSTGNVYFGNVNSVTNIGGTVDVTNTDTIPAQFRLLKLKNLTGGGTITAQGTLGFYLQNDTLLLNSLSISGYRGSEYGYLFDSRITGNVNIADDASYGGGYYTTIRNSTITGNTVYTINSTNFLYDGHTANSTNSYIGHVTYNLNSTTSAAIATGDTVSVTGNLVINRTGNGQTNAFGFGGNIGGNLSFVNNTAGNLYMGNLNSTTLVNGMINITKNDTIPTEFELFRIKNLTSGGMISTNKTKGFSLRKDTLLVASISLLDYQGSQYAYLFDNKITGNVTTSDNATFGGGYLTQILNNSILGNTSYTIQGPNGFYDANVGISTNTYSGNVTYNITGPALINIATGDTAAVSGNFVVNRTAPGTTTAFGFGGIIGGNFLFTNNTGGSSGIGGLASSTNVGGTVNVSIQATSDAPVSIRRLINNTGGGSIILQNTRGFDLRQDTLRVNTLSLTGYRGNEYAYLFDNKISGNLVVADDATYGGGYFTNITNNNISGTASFTINGSNQFYDATGSNTGNTYMGNVVYTRNATGALMSVATGDTSYYGSGLTFNSNIAQPINRSFIQFVGNADGAYSQTGTQSSILPNVIMRKSAGARLSLNSPLTIGNRLVLDSGIIAATPANKLIIPDNITYTGSSNKSFVEGPMDKIGNDAFIFPVGKDTAIAPISISAPAAITDVFTATYIHKSPQQDGYDTSMKAPTLDHVSRAEYWMLNRTTGTSNVTVTLSFDTLKRSGRVINPAELRVSRWNGSLWTDEGNGGTTGTPAMGTVVSAAAITSFGPFTLASITAQNTLPVRLISFTATEQNGIVSLEWKAESEVNFSHYEVERSSNATAFTEVLFRAARNQVTQTLYSGVDQPNATGVFYYRLKMVDKDGKFAYSDIVSIKINSKIFITISPNPVKDRMTVKGLSEGSTLRIMDLSGKLILSKIVRNNSSQQVDLPQVPAGMYILQVLDNSTIQTISFIKE